MGTEYTSVSGEELQVMNMLDAEYNRQGLEEFRLRWDDSVPGYEFEYVNGNETITGVVEVVRPGDFKIVEDE